jgi:hypothetical protein
MCEISNRLYFIARIVQPRQPNVYLNQPHNDSSRDIEIKIPVANFRDGLGIICAGPLVQRTGNFYFLQKGSYLSAFTPLSKRQVRPCC